MIAGAVRLVVAAGFFLLGAAAFFAVGVIAWLFPIVGMPMLVIAVLVAALSFRRRTPVAELRIRFVGDDDGDGRVPTYTLPPSPGREPGEPPPHLRPGPVVPHNVRTPPPAPEALTARVMYRRGLVIRAASLERPVRIESEPERPQDLAAVVTWPSDVVPPGSELYGVLFSTGASLLASTDDVELRQGDHTIAAALDVRQLGPLPAWSLPDLGIDVRTGEIAPYQAPGS